MPYGQPMRQVSPQEGMMQMQQQQMMRPEMKARAKIRAFNQNPEIYDNNERQEIEALAEMYGLSIKRGKMKDKATWLENLGAGAGGAVDAALFGMIPDDWYSSRRTAAARNIGGGIGLAASLLIPGYGLARGAGLAAKGAQLAAKAGLAGKFGKALGGFTLPGAIMKGKQMLAPAASRLATQPGIGGTIGGGILKGVGGAKTLGKVTARQSDEIIKAAKAGQLDKVGSIASKVGPGQTDDIIKAAVNSGVAEGSLAHTKLVSSLPGRTSDEIIATVSKIKNVGKKTIGKVKAEKVIAAVRSNPTATTLTLRKALREALGIKGTKKSAVVDRLMGDKKRLMEILTPDTAKLTAGDALAPGIIAGAAGMFGPGILSSSETYNPYQAEPVDPMMP